MTILYLFIISPLFIFHQMRYYLIIIFESSSLFLQFQQLLNIHFFRILEGWSLQYLISGRVVPIEYSVEVFCGEIKGLVYLLSQIYLT